MAASGWAAIVGVCRVYRRDLFEAYDKFVEEQRRTRPSEKYREATQQEWSELIEHFGQRKIALGSCRRPYVADVVHGHA